MASVAFMSISPETVKKWFALETDMEYLEKIAGPKASVAALNKMRVTIVHRTARKVWEDSKSAYIVDFQRNKLMPGKVKTNIKLNHVKQRIYSSKVTRKASYTRISGYIEPIPLISLNARLKGGAGTIFKGQQTHAKGATPKKGAQTGGIKIGSTNIPGAFLQLANKKRNLHIWMRKTDKTWKPGKYGWGREPGTTQADRMPYEVAKLDLKPAFDQHFEKTIEEVVEERSQIEYERALAATAARILRDGTY